MALDNGNGEGDVTFINLKVVAPAGPIENKKDEPKFVKLDSDFKETGDTYRNVSGTLKKLKGTYTKITRGEVFGFKAFIKDGEEMYVVESTITNASKDMLNSLLTQIGKKVSISLYLNKNDYPTACVKDSGGSHVEQKFDFKSLNNTALYEEVKRLEAESDAKAAESDEANPNIGDEDIPF